MKKICFVLSASNTKGANGAFIELLDSLDKNKFRPYVILPNDGPIVNELKVRSILFKIFYYKWWMHVEYSPRWKWLARTLINFVNIFPICYQILRWRCDIVYTNTITINVGLFASILLRKSHIFHIHEFGHKDHRLIFDFGKTISFWLANKFTKQFIFISHAVADEYSRFINKDKSIVIYQPVTLPTGKSSVPELKKYNFQCLIVGRISENKGQIDAIRSVNILIKDGLDIGLWIVGDGDLIYKKYLERVVKENSIEEHVIFYGWHNNPTPFFKKADIYLMCSKCEGFGRVTVEAMLCGTPVIGTNCGGTQEIIKDNYNGLLYCPGDFLELSRKICFLSSDSQKRKKIARVAQIEAMKKFQHKNYGKKIEKLLILV